MSNKCFACNRLGNVPSDQRRYVGLFSYEVALELAHSYAEQDGAPVELIRDEGSGKRQLKIFTVNPRSPAKVECKA